MAEWIAGSAWGAALIALVLRTAAARGAQPGFDVYGHLCFARLVRAQRSGPFGAVTLPLVGAAPYTQPFVWHWIVSFLGADLVARHQAWLNAAVDAVFVGVAVVLAQHAGFDAGVIAWAVVLYLLTPMWFSTIAIGPRVAGFTPRMASEAASNLFFLVCLVDIGWPLPLQLAVGAALAAFVLSSSKFGVQVLLFLVLPTSLLAASATPVLALAIGLLATGLLSRGRLFAQLAAQVRHLAWYCRQNLLGRMHVSNRNSLRLLLARGNLARGAYLRKLAQRALSENSYTAVLLKLPVLLPVAVVLAHEVARTGTLPLATLSAPVIAATALLVIINFKPFLFLGEAERYLNHVAFPLVLLAASLVDGTVLALLLAYGLLYWLAETFALQKLTPAHLHARLAEDTQIITALRQRSEPAVVLSYPFQAGGGVFRIGLETAHRAVYPLCTGADFAARFEAEYAAAYPYVRLERLDAMADEYGINFLVLDRRDLEARMPPGWAPSARWQALPLGGEVYRVFERRAPAASAS